VITVIDPIIAFFNEEHCLHCMDNAGQPSYCREAGHVVEVVRTREPTLAAELMIEFPTP
jgi:hypothetical protein